MHRFYVPDLARQCDTLSLQGPEAIHALRVLRVQHGEQVTVLNGCGTLALSRVVHVGRERVDLQVEHLEQAPRPSFKITLFQAITKPKSMEWIVQKAVELGAHTVQPVVTARVVPQPAESGWGKKVDKWRRIAVEAIKQCGQPWLPRIETPASLTDLLGNAAGSFLACLQSGAQPLRQWLEEEIDLFESSKELRIGLWIGPEGDFTGDEIQAILAAGGRPVTFGPGILRSETAALCGLALLNYELNLLETRSGASPT